MIKHLLKKEYPTMKPSDYRKAVAFISGKCSQYYFLDYLRTTDGNVDDAIAFYIFDDRLRSLLVQYLIRFEIQIKTDFVSFVEASTHSSSFWKKRKFYLLEARHPCSKGKSSKYTLLYKKLQNNISRLHFSTMGPPNYVAMYSSSFGTFQELFKLIDSPHKKLFIAFYTSGLKQTDYRALNSYFEVIRRVRNRCAHGNHVITLKMVNDLNNLRSSIMRASPIASPAHMTVLEALFSFLIAKLNCGKEFKRNLLFLLKQNESILTKYSGQHALSANSIRKLL